MSDPSKTEPEAAPEDLAGRSHPVRWSGEEWTLLARAAGILAEREHLKLTVTDIIRSGAIRRAEEIVAAAESDRRQNPGRRASNHVSDAVV